MPLRLGTTFAQPDDDASQALLSLHDREAARKRATGTMIVQITLAAGTTRGAGSEVEVETAMNIDTNDPRWTTSLVNTVTQHANEGARRLVTQLTPPLPAGAEGFVPLADIAPQINVSGISR